MMSTTTMPSREFNQDTGRAKSQAEGGPVIITDRGRPAHVLMTYEEYVRLTGVPGTIIELLGLPGELADIDLEVPSRADLPRPAALS